jgi:hypothetical protein
MLLQEEPSGSTLFDRMQKNIAAEAAPTTKRKRIDRHRNPRRPFATFVGAPSGAMPFGTLRKEHRG